MNHLKLILDNQALILGRLDKTDERQGLLLKAKKIDESFPSEVLGDYVTLHEMTIYLLKRFLFLFQKNYLKKVRKVNCISNFLLPCSFYFYYTFYKIR